jgi:hypothetical protein
MKRNDIKEAKQKIEMLTNHLLDSIDVDLLSDAQKIAYLKAIQPYVMPKLSDIKQTTDMNVSDNLQWLFSASESEVEQAIQGQLKKIS